MCVIIGVSQDAPDVEQKEWDAALRVNNDGYGVAWIEDNLVQFRKMLPANVKNWRDWRPPKPYIMHFRMATIGSEIPEMCHPFIVSNTSRLATRGRAQKVLFHNGHWSDWNEWLAITYSGKGKIPNGEFSDSRALAVMVGHYGGNILNISGALAAGQKIAVFSKTGKIEYYGVGWETDEDKTVRSNRFHLATGYAGMDSGWNGDLSENKDCILCHMSFYSYSEEDELCWNCYRKNKITFPYLSSSKKTSTLPALPVSAIAKARCMACGYSNRGFVTGKGINICMTCQREGVVAKCGDCALDLYVAGSLACGYCATCRVKPEHLRGQEYFRAWKQIEDELKAFNPACAWLPRSFSLVEQADGTPHFYLAGRPDNKHLEFVEGNITPDGITLYAVTYDDALRKQLGADDDERTTEFAKI